MLKNPYEKKSSSEKDVSSWFDYNFISTRELSVNERYQNYLDSADKREILEKYLKNKTSKRK